MSLSFKVSDKELLAVRNKIFKEFGIPELEKNGFVKRPFKSSWFGEYYSGIQGYIYEFGRISDNSCLEYIDVYIVRGDRYIKVFLNIFKLSPEINSIEQLQGCVGLNYGLPPNSLTEMQLRSDDYKGPPLFYMLFCPEHKLGRSCSKRGFDRKVSKLAELIKKDMANIDSFVKRWHELHQVNQTDWEGKVYSVKK